MSIDIKNFLIHLELKSPIYNTLLEHPVKLSQASISDLFYYSSKLNLTPSTKYHSLHLLMSICHTANPTNLIIPCLLISSKMHQNAPITFSELKSVTNQSKPSILKLEIEILSGIQQDLTQNTLFDWVSAFAELCFASFSPDSRKTLRTQACEFIDFLYIQQEILECLPVGIVSASILGCTVVKMTGDLKSLSCLKNLAFSLHVGCEVIEKLAGQILELFSEYENFGKNRV